MPQHAAATSPLIRGPTRSSQRPKAAAESPRKTIASVKTQPSWVSFQSSGAGAVIPIALASGRLKTLKAYACPIDR